MKLYFHPASTTSRPIVHFCAEQGIPLELSVVDLMTGEHHKAPFSSINPSCQVPVLQDGDFVLTEVSAILKYIAEKHNSAAYPKDLQKRARINEVMDWFNTNLYREWGYNLIYPQIFPHHKRATDEAHAGVVSWGKEKSERWLGVLDQHMLANKKFLTGDEITIADYFAAQILSAGDLIGVNLAKYPNIDRYMKTMRALPKWKQTNEVADGFAASLKDKQFTTIA
ncbi:MAG: glutathione S-transferase family protein [Polyangiales bacterium]